MILAEPGPHTRQRLGRLGEAAAESALREAGLQILERRFRIRLGEIDLIAGRDDLVVFVEVKARRGLGYGWPSESVTPHKQRRIARVALAYLSRRGWLDRACRFDVVEVRAVAGRIEQVRHIEDAFRPPARI